MYVIGTAGHIDHGKSTLIHSLTNMHPDRLQAERERGMTIDLGFAWLTLPSGTEIGIVDVPGHHRFIDNMLAGVGGIRLTLFVIAANDSWMPQTQEHLEILDLLGVERGIVVLTKKDLVDDDWLELVQEDVRERLHGTSLAGAPTVAVSAATGAGMDELARTIDAMLADLPPAPDYGRPRLWVDRVFSMKGTGTVVTGTLEGGTLALEQAVELMPGGKRARVRGLQTYARAVDEARPGTRVAVNLAGVDTDELARGDAVLAGVHHAASLFVNVDLRMLPAAPHELEDLATLKLYVGSAALQCRVRLLEGDTAGPGERVLAQLWLEREAALRFGDRFVLRDATYQRTVGGGRIIDEAAARVRRPSLRVVAAHAPLRLPGAPAQSVLSLELLRERRQIAESGSTAYDGLVKVLLAERHIVSNDELAAVIPLPVDKTTAAVNAVVARGEAVALPSYVIQRQAWESFTLALRKRVAEHHEEYPLRPGIGRETARTSLDVTARLFEECVPLLSEQGHIVAEGAHLRLPEHALRFSREQEQAVARLMALLEEQPYAPPIWFELVEQHQFDTEFLNALIGRGDVVKVDEELLFSGAVIKKIESDVKDHIERHGSIDVRALRDMLQTSRKYALPILEYFDRIGVTRRVGDVRVLAE